MYKTEKLFCEYLGATMKTFAMMEKLWACCQQFAKTPMLSPDFPFAKLLASRWTVIKGYPRPKEEDETEGVAAAVSAEWEPLTLPEVSSLVEYEVFAGSLAMTGNGVLDSGRPLARKA